MVLKRSLVVVDAGVHDFAGSGQHSYPDSLILILLLLLIAHHWQTVIDPCGERAVGCDWSVGAGAVVCSRRTDGVRARMLRPRPRRLGRPRGRLYSTLLLHSHVPGTRCHQLWPLHRLGHTSHGLTLFQGTAVSRARQRDL